MNVPASSHAFKRSLAVSSLVLVTVFVAGAFAGGFTWQHFDERRAEARVVLRGLGRFETQRNEALRALASTPEGAVGAGAMSEMAKAALTAAYDVAFRQGTRILQEELALSRTKTTGLSLDAARVAVQRSAEAGELRVSLPRIVFDVTDIEAFPALVSTPACRRRLLFVDAERCASCRTALAALVDADGETCIHHVVLPTGGADTLATSRLTFCLGQESPRALRDALVSSATPPKTNAGAKTSAALRLAAEDVHESLLTRPSERARVDACIASADVGSLLATTARSLHAASLHAPSIISGVSAFTLAGQSAHGTASDTGKEDVLAWLLKD